MRKFLALALLAGFGATAMAQIPSPSSSTEVMQAYKNWKAKEEASMFTGLSFQNLGPTEMGGRVVDLEVNPKNPDNFFLAFASGGLWETQDAGKTWTSLFDKEACIGIGDIYVDWQHKKQIWIGTGESNSSRSSYAGHGLYKSSDAGKTWQHCGLDDTHHIGRVIVHPKNPEIVWVAAIGHLFSTNAERGVFKSSDAGKTWKKVLYINDSTGVIDLCLDPKNPDVLYAAAWERMRKPWHFKGSGEGSAIYKSMDGGATWSNLNATGKGLPKGEHVGRIGLAISPKNSSKVYAIVDNQQARTQKVDSKLLTAEKLRNSSVDDVCQLPDSVLNDFVKTYFLPEGSSATSIRKDLKEAKLTIKDLIAYVDDAKANIVENQVIGAEIYCSLDAGKTWVKKTKGFIEDFYYTYGYYFGHLQVFPDNDEELLAVGVPILRSTDGGITHSLIYDDAMHVDHHAIWISPSDPNLIFSGNDGGVNISRDRGKTWQDISNIPVAQYYAVHLDQQEPFYTIHGGLQDNGVWSVPSVPLKSPNKLLFMGDGMQVQVDPRDHSMFYYGIQFGYYLRKNHKTGSEDVIRPSNIQGEDVLRFNWETPICLSTHNYQHFYIASHRLHKSENQGSSYTAVSPDLSYGPKDGNIPFGTSTCIEESPNKAGTLYVGTDDGRVHRTQNDGKSWTEISTGLPKGLWVSCIEASKYSEGSLFVSLSGFRFDNFEAHLYFSADFGQNWQRIGANLPMESVNVVREDPVNPSIVYVGTDRGAYVSLDRGESFQILGSNLPRVAVHDLAIHEKSKELVLGTHGRSLYKMDVSALQQYSENLTVNDLSLFEKNYRLDISKNAEIDFSKFQLPISFFVGNGQKSYSFAVKLPSGKVLRSGTCAVNPGYQHFVLALSPSKQETKLLLKEFSISLPKGSSLDCLPVGEYQVEFTVGSTKKSLSVKID